MASTIKTKYDTGTTLTCTLASLANSSARSSTAVDNTTNLYADVLVQVQIKTAAASTSSTGYVNIYVYSSADAGTTYTEGAGTDAGVTLTSPPNARVLGVLNCVANATTYKSHTWSVASAFGGVMPDHWGIIIENKTGAALDATEGNHKKLMTGIWGQTV